MAPRHLASCRARNFRGEFAMARLKPVRAVRACRDGSITSSGRVSTTSPSNAMGRWHDSWPNCRVAVCVPVVVWLSIFSLCWQGENGCDGRAASGWSTFTLLPQAISKCFGSILGVCTYVEACRLPETPFCGLAQTKQQNCAANSDCGRRASRSSCIGTGGHSPPLLDCFRRTQQRCPQLN